MHRRIQGVGTRSFASRSLATVAFLCLLDFAGTRPILAQQAEEAAALAQAAQNPLANVISVPVQWNSNFKMGPQGRTQHVILIQPIVPFSLSAKLTLLTRHILPVINSPALGGDGPAFGPILLPLREMMHVLT